MKLPSIEAMHEHAARADRKRRRGVARAKPAAPSLAGLLRPTTRVQLSKRDARRYKNASDVATAFAEHGFRVSETLCEYALAHPAPRTRVEVYADGAGHWHAVKLATRASMRPTSIDEGEEEEDDDDQDDDQDDDDDPIVVGTDDDDDDDETEREQSMTSKERMRELQESIDRCVQLGDRRITAAEVAAEYQDALRQVQRTGQIVFEVTKGRCK